MMRRGLLQLATRRRFECCRRNQSAMRHFSSSASNTERRRNVTTNVQDAFTIPMTLVDVHLRDEQLPFAYFFHETLDTVQLESSLSRVLESYPILGGKVNLTSGVIECHPKDSVSLSFTQSKLTLPEWLEEAPSQRMTPGRPAQVLSPLFECLKHTENAQGEPSSEKNTLASIRVTHFEGGGTALGVNLSHAVADAASCVRFVQCWGRAMQGLSFPTASNQRSHATCSGMLSPELLDMMDLNDVRKQQQWSLATMLLALGIEWSDDKQVEAKDDVVVVANTEKDTHEYISLTFSPELLKAMKAHGMAHCTNGTGEVEFVSTNDVLTAFGWMMKRRLSRNAAANMSMVVNLRGRSDVDNFSHIDDADGSDGVFGNGISSIIATLPAGNDIELDDMSAAAVTIRLALTEGISDIPDRLLLSRRGRPATDVSSSMGCFSFTSWQHFPLYDISFSSEGGELAAFRGHPSHPLPEGDTYHSIIVPEKCGSHTYQLLAPSSKVQEAEEFHNEIRSLYLEWYGDHTMRQTQNCK